MTVTLDRPWLTLDLGAPHRLVSWAPHRPGVVTARRILWREVRDADLTPDFDAAGWLAAQMRARGAARAVGMLTSRDLGRFVRAEATVEGQAALCVATVGLGNAETVGRRKPAPQAGYGTINLGIRLSAALTLPALVEALSIAAEARTAAVMDHGPRLAAGPATGTGTDCIALAAPTGRAAHAGLHTAVGEALGRAVRAAVAEGVRAWMAEQAPPRG